MFKSKKHKDAALTLLVVAIVAIVGHMDFIDQEREQRDYCRMVEMELWPNYKDIPCEKVISNN